VKIIGILILVVLLAGCGSVGEIAGEYVAATTPAPDYLPSRFVVVSGEVLDFDGPIDELGNVPWYVEWFRIWIVQNDESIVEIVGTHNSIFAFGAGLEPGMIVRAYVSVDSPDFIGNMPVFVATAIAGEADIPMDEIIAHYDNLALFLPVDMPETIVLQVGDYLYDYSTFCTIDLPIIVNGVDIGAPDPIMVGDMIFVPFRPIFMAGIGFGNYAFITAEGGLAFGGGGAGSENSHWWLGDRRVRGIGWYWMMEQPPIIVGGIIYVPLVCAFTRAPGSAIWIWDDKIEIFSRDRYPYGPWLGSPWREGWSLPAELAHIPVYINGAALGDVKLYHCENQGLHVPLAPFAAALGFCYTDFWQSMTIDNEIFIRLWEFNSRENIRMIIDSGRLLIKN